jgi:uncharacterized membrane protein YfcA
MLGTALLVAGGILAGAIGGLLGLGGGVVLMPLLYVSAKFILSFFEVTA